MEINTRFTQLLFAVVFVFTVVAVWNSPVWSAPAGDKERKITGEQSRKVGPRRLKFTGQRYVPKASQAQPVQAQQIPEGASSFTVCYSATPSGSVQEQTWSMPATASSGTQGQTYRASAAPAPGPGAQQSQTGSVCYSGYVPPTTSTVYLWNQPAGAYANVSGQTAPPALLPPPPALPNPVAACNACALPASSPGYTWSASAGCPTCPGLRGFWNRLTGMGSTCTVASCY